MFINVAFCEYMESGKSSAPSIFPIFNLREYVVVFKIATLPHRTKKGIFYFLPPFHEVA